MNLTCEAVEDLYVLYQENELHLSVIKAVDEHLQTCSKCSKLYEIGEGFSKTKDMKIADQSLEPSIKLDQQIRLKLKLRRLRITLLFFVAVFVIYSFFHYVDERKTLLYEVSSLEKTVWDLYYQLGHVKQEGDFQFSTSTLISDLNEKTTRIDRHLNFYENREAENHPYQMNLNFNLTSMVNLLHSRYQSGQLTEQDEKALTEIRAYLEEYGKLLTDERLKLNHVSDYHFSALFKPFKVKELKSIHQNIDQLGYTYSNYQDFPNELEIMTEEDLKKMAREVFQEPKAEVSITPKQNPEVVAGYGTFTTLINGEKGQYHAEWEAYTGRLLSFSNHEISSKGELLEKDQVEEMLQEFVSNLFGTKSFNYEYQGINYNYSSNVDHKLYTYKITPTNDEYKVDASYRLYIDARTGNVVNLFPLEKEYYSHLAFSSSEIVVKQEDAAKIAERIHSSFNFKYIETVYIPSLLSNKYELVHKLEGTNNQYNKIILLNVQDGNEEKSY